MTYNLAALKRTNDQRSIFSTPERVRSTSSKLATSVEIDRAAFAWVRSDPGDLAETDLDSPEPTIGRDGADLFGPFNPFSLLHLPHLARGQR